MGRRFYTIDSETPPARYGRKLQPFIWGVYDGQEFLTFEKTEDLIAFIRANPDAIFFAHNGGKFDFHFIAEYINRDEPILIINSRLVKARIGKAEIRDSYALLPFPLSAYKKDEIDYSIFEAKERRKPENWKKIIEYLRGDCVYLWDLIAAFIAEYGWHLTAPGAAIKQLQKMEGIKIENSGQYFFNEFQKYYFGGRCECIQPGSYNGQLTYIDLNSAYMDAMRHQHPIGDEWEFKHYSQPPLIPMGFYTVMAKSYGAFCRRDKDGSLKFDRDGEVREYHTTGWELKAALETKTAVIVKHVEQVFFKETKAFDTFINHFWGQRQTSKKGTTENLFAKLMGNSAYGKMASNPENYETYVLFDPAINEYLVKHGWDICGEIGGHTIASRPLEQEDMRFYNVATGASITGFVRAVLLRALANVERPIYCDTDSIIFTGKHTLPLSNELGQWKLEGIFTEGHFAGKKLYAVKNKKEEKIASKGSILTFKQIKKITAGSVIEYKQDFAVMSWWKEPSFLKRDIRRTA